MPQLPSSRGGRWRLTAAALLAPFLATGCTLVQPGCRNRDVKAAIEHEARESVELWMSTSGLSAPPADTPVSLADQVEVGRQGNTHSCSANVVVGRGQDEVRVPIEYEVVAGDDGQPYYQWDKDDFGKKLIGTALVSVLQALAHAKTIPQKEPGSEHQPDIATTPDQPPAAVPQPESATASLDIMSAWKRSVHAEILHRAKALTDMPSGTQRMRFRIGPDGDITIASARPPIENTALADKLVAFLESSDHVAKPPFGKATWVEVTFRF